MGKVKQFRDSARLAVATLLTIGSALTIGLSSFGAASAATFNNGGPGCSVNDPAPMAQSFTVSGNTATTTVRVMGPATCRETVSLASWNAAIGSSGFVGQRFFAGQTFTLAPGMHSLSIPINNSCTYQVDVVLGARQTSAAGNAMYSPAVLMGFLQVRGAACQAPAPSPQPQPTPQPTPAPTQTTTNVCSGNVTNTASAPASQGGNCSTNTTIVQNQTQTPASPTPPQTQSQNQQQSQQANVNANTNVSAGAGSGPSVGTSSNVAASQSQVSAVPATTETTTPSAPVTTSSAPTSLVNTGPATIGGMIGLFTGVTLLGTLAYDWALRRKLQT